MQDDLKQKSREELLQMWRNLFKTEPPSDLNKSYLVMHLAWQMQANKLGGLSATAQKQINKLVEQYAKTKSIDSKTIKKVQKFGVTTGTRFIREFKGEKHEVTALDKGFNYDGKTYKSLSAIANEITGTRWNGKKFFGVA